MKLIFRRVEKGLFPVDDQGAEVLTRLRHGDLVTVEVKQPHNIKHYALYFALIRTVWDNLDHDQYPSLDDFHNAVKIECGIVRRIRIPSGFEVLVPGSISWGSMDNAEFQVFYDKACQVLCEKFLVGMDEEVLKHEVFFVAGIQP